MEWINTDIDFDEKVLRLVKSNIFFQKRAYHGNNNHFFSKKSQMETEFLIDGVKPLLKPFHYSNSRNNDEGVKCYDGLGCFPTEFFEKIMIEWVLSLGKDVRQQIEVDSNSSR